MSSPVVRVNETMESTVFKREARELSRRAWVPCLAQAGAALGRGHRSSWPPLLPPLQDRSLRCGGNRLTDHKPDLMAAGRGPLPGVTSDQCPG